jgi:hypothetical protein
MTKKYRLQIVREDNGQHRRTLMASSFVVLPEEDVTHDDCVAALERAADRLEHSKEGQ